jgi:hypothetical protein
MILRYRFIGRRMVRQSGNEGNMAVRMRLLRLPRWWRRKLDFRPAGFVGRLPDNSIKN